MRLVSAFREAGRVRGVFCDIDDTLTTEGRLTALAYAALERLRAAGKLVVPITSRPAGWCDHIARLWPVDAVVGENGGFYFCYDAAARRLVRRFLDDEATRAAQRARLAAVRERILHEVPGSALTSDHSFRETDIAIDFCEEMPRLPAAAIERIVAIMEASGLTAKLGPTRVNGRFGHCDALGMIRALMQERFGVDLDQPRARGLCLRERLARGCADVRVLSALGGRGQCARCSGTDAGSADIHHHRPLRRGICRAGRDDHPRGGEQPMNRAVTSGD